MGAEKFRGSFSDPKAKGQQCPLSTQTSPSLLKTPYYHYAKTSSLSRCANSSFPPLSFSVSSIFIFVLLKTYPLAWCSLDSSDSSFYNLFNFSRSASARYPIGMNNRRSQLWRSRCTTTVETTCRRISHDSFWRSMHDLPSTAVHRGKCTEPDCFLRIH